MAAYKALMTSLATLFGAVADPTRLAVLALLQRHGERCVCEIHGILGVSQSRASRALKELRLAGLVSDRRVGTWIHYRLPDAPGEAQRRLLEAVAVMVPPGDAAVLDDKVRSYEAQRPSGCPSPGVGLAGPLTSGA